MEVEEIETVELDGKRFIQLETYRQWPKLGVLWSVRQHSGDSDFPLARGSEEQLPRAGQDTAEVWALLRAQALAAAQDAAQTAAPAASEQKRTSFFGRLFHRD